MVTRAEGGRWHALVADERPPVPGVMELGTGFGGPVSLVGVCFGSGASLVIWPPGTTVHVVRGRPRLVVEGRRYRVRHRIHASLLGRGPDGELVLRDVRRRRSWVVEGAVAWATAPLAYFQRRPSRNLR